jgi:CBS domain-containing protein
MMVMNEAHKLIGMISMYDILLLMRPKHIHIWADMNDIDVTGLIDTTCERAKSILVGDIMTRDLITVSPDTHLFVILDIMIKKHIRRIPVIEDERIAGIVYISDLFYYLSQKLTD